MFHFFFSHLGFQFWQIIIGTPVFEEMLKLNFGLDVWHPIVYSRTMLFTNFPGLSAMEAYAAMQRVHPMKFGFH